jgi:hypothetical protein
MTAGLSFLFQAKDFGVAKTLAGAVMPEQSAPGPDILHYLWLVEVPAVPAPSGYKSFLLTTVYDEDFTSYIQDLVNNNPAPFNAAAAEILGFENVAGKLPQADALQEFIALIAERDLTQTNPVNAFVAFYPWTAAYIHAKLGPHASEQEVSAAGAASPAIG